MRRLALVAACLVLASACGANGSPEPSQPSLLAAPPSTSATPGTLAQKVAEPSRIRIPSIGVDARIVKVGLKANGDMETPRAREKPSDPLLAGWYKLARRPGENGPAVIVGHVDGRQGGDVFVNLHKLKKGAKVTVLDSAKHPVQFVVKRLEHTLKTEVDWERILKTKGSTLWLFTCGGPFDHSTGHYQENLIIESVRA